MDRASGLAWPVSASWQSRGTARDARAVSARDLARRSPRLPPRIEANLDALGSWVGQACRRLDLEAEPAEIPYNAVERTLRHAGPALLMLARSGRRVLPGARRNKAACGGRPGTGWPAAPGAHERDRRAAAPGCGCTSGADGQTLLIEAGIPAARRPQAGLAILRDQIGSAPISPCWLLRLRPDAPFWQHVRQALLTRHLLVFSSAYRRKCLCVGDRVVDRRRRRARGPFRRGDARCLDLPAPDARAPRARRRLVAGRVRHRRRRTSQAAPALRGVATGTGRDAPQGVGQHLARVIESESIESLMLAAGFAALATGVDLLLAAAIFVAASQITHLVLFARHPARHRGDRVVVLQTAPAVDGRATPHDAGPGGADGGPPDPTGAGAAIALARAGRRIARAVSRALVTDGSEQPGVLGRSALLDDDRDARARAIVRDGPKLSRDAGGQPRERSCSSMGALARLTSTFGYVAGAAVAWKQVKPLLEAARRPEDRGPCRSCAVNFPGKGVAIRPARGGKGSRLSVSRPGQPALEDCSFRISHGDRIHLSGPSGSGKSTLVSLLTGLRTPGLRRSAARRTRSGDARRRRLAATRGRGPAVPRESRVHREPRFQSAHGTALAGPAPRTSSSPRRSAGGSSWAICSTACRAGCFNS